MVKGSVLVGVDGLFSRILLPNISLIISPLLYSLTLSDNDFSSCDTNIPGHTMFYAQPASVETKV